MKRFGIAIDISLIDHTCSIIGTFGCEYDVVSQNITPVSNN